MNVWRMRDPFLVRNRSVDRALVWTGPVPVLSSDPMVWYVRVGLSQCENELRCPWRVFDSWVRLNHPCVVRKHAWCVVHAWRHVAAMYLTITISGPRVVPCMVNHACVAVHVAHRHMARNHLQSLIVWHVAILTMLFNQLSATWYIVRECNLHYVATWHSLIISWHYYGTRFDLLYEFMHCIWCWHVCFFRMCATRVLTALCMKMCATWRTNEISLCTMCNTWLPCA